MDPKVFQEQFGLMGDSAVMRQVIEKIRQIAPTDITVLLNGESGVGKDVTARAIHGMSLRKRKNLIIVNCGAIPEGIIESELFGHEKGSFTSAIKQRKGDFELANGGTIFLDEIGDMSLSAQAKVLRALQENKITRVGGEKEIKVDVRVIAATNKNLKDEIERGNFREDLYHRLSVILINVPSLSDRPEDIELLSQYFLQSFATDNGKSKLVLNQDAIDALKEMPWTGNIRELRNVIERLSILCEKTITRKCVETFVKPLMNNNGI